MVATHAAFAEPWILVPSVWIGVYLSISADPDVLRFDSDGCNYSADQAVFPGPYRPTVNRFVIAVESIRRSEPDVVPIDSDRRDLVAR